MSDPLPSQQFAKPQRKPHHPVPMRPYPGQSTWRPSPMAATPRAAPPPNMSLTPDWRLLFNDHFSASNVDMEKWWTRYVYEDGYLDYLNDEWQRYRESGNHVCYDSICHLTANTYDAAEGFWPSGMLRSKDCYPICDGNEWYFEGRLKSPSFIGCWPGFWLAGSELVPGDDSSIPWPPELDILEIANNGTDDTTAMIHMAGWVLDWNNNPQKYAGTWAAAGWNSDYSFWHAPFDAAGGFHTYGLWYKRPEYCFYIDRKPIYAGGYDFVSDAGQPMSAYLEANLAVGGAWAGRYGVDNTALPQSFDIDYIRVYARVPQSTIGHDLLPR